jgi:hypothetical protein
VAVGQNERNNYRRKTAMDNEQVGDEVSIVIGRFIPASNVKDYFGDNFYVYFDSCDPTGSSPPSRILACEYRQELEILDKHLGGDWWRLDDDSERWVYRWVEGVAEA